MITEKCDCYCCQAGITNTTRNEKLKKFMVEMYVLILKDKDGFITSTPDNEVRLVGQGMVDIFFIETKEGQALPEVNKELLAFTINKAASFYETPFHFYEAFREIESDIQIPFQAAAEDNYKPSLPIISGLITPEIFHNYMKTGDYPENIKKVLNASSAYISELKSKYIN